MTNLLLDWSHVCDWLEKILSNHCLLFKDKISYFCIIILTNHCFQANFQAFYIFPVKIVSAIFLDLICKSEVKLTVQLIDFCCNGLHSYAFGKVRESVGEIKYAYAPSANF